MMNKIIVVALLFGCTTPSLGQFIIPIQGKQNIDWFLVNYVDRDSSIGSIRDYKCNKLTYDGHQGTDFVLRDFRQMDSGVSVYAAKSGKVYFTTDGKFDRSKQADTGGYGNFISINHGDSLYTIYAHLRKFSLLVNIGDSVYQGQSIATVASSGKAEDPHLHFEVWNHGFIVDPFGEHCPLELAVPGMFNQPPPYENDFSVISDGILGSKVTLDSIREHPSDETSLRILSDSVISYWIHGLSIHLGDSVRIDWKTPSNTVWYTYSYHWDNNHRYWYLWTYIDGPRLQKSMPPGKWRVEFYLNDSLRSDHQFSIPTLTAAQSDIEEIMIYPTVCVDNFIVRSKEKVDEIRLCNVVGQLYPVSVSMMPLGATAYWESLPSGMYIASVKTRSLVQKNFRVCICR